MPESEVTDVVLAAKRAAGLSFTALAEALQIEEEAVAEILFRHKQGTAQQAVELARALRQPSGGLDGLAHPLPAAKESYWGRLSKDFVDKSLTALLTGIIVFFVQDCYNRQQQIRDRGAASASAVSSILSGQTSKLVEEYKMFRAQVRALTPLIAASAPTSVTEPAIAELKSRHGAISDCLDVLVPFAPGVAGTQLELAFKTRLSELVADLSANEVPKDLAEQLTDLSLRLRELVSALQQDLRRAVEQEYQRSTVSKGEK